MSHCVRQPFKYLHQSGDLVRGQKVIRIQPLNVIPLGQREGFVSCCGGPLIVLRENADAVGFEPPRNHQRLVSGAIIYDDDLLSLPGCTMADRSVSAIHSCALNAGIRIDAKGFMMDSRTRRWHQWTRDFLQTRYYFGAECKKYHTLSDLDSLPAL
jgi:hypothetical protein